MLALVTVGAVLLVHVAAPFLRLDRVPPLAVLAGILEPLGLYRLLAADAAALQRFRLYASGVGALAAVGLSMTVGLGLSSPGRWRLVPLGLVGVFFATLLYAADNRGSMIAAALTLGTLVVWWRPRLLLIAALVVFGTLDLIALGLAQRGLDLRTVVERLEFWRNGLLLAGETPFTGVGLGVSTVQTVYRAVFQPAYPPFSHAHNVFVQALLEQGVLGLAGLILASVALLRLGVVAAGSDSRARAASLAAAGGALALLTAGLTEIVALTTVGGALLFGLLGLLVASHDAAPRVEAATPAEASRWSKVVRRLTALPTIRRPRRWAAAPGRPRARSLAGDGGGTFARRAPVPERRHGRAVPRDARRGSKPPGAPPNGRLGGVGAPHGHRRRSRGRRRPPEPEPGPGSQQRLRDGAPAGRGGPRPHLGRRPSTGCSASGGRSRRAATGTAPSRPGPRSGPVRSFSASAASWSRVRPGSAASRRSSRRRRSARRPARRRTPSAGRRSRTASRPTGRSFASRRCWPPGGTVEYFALLQKARLYRLDGRLDAAQDALYQTAPSLRDAQFAIEFGLLLLAREQVADAEQPLLWAVENPSDPPMPVPDGDDPLYWLATVQLRLGKAALAAVTARAGLASLPAEQASLRVPYHLLLGESLLAAGDADEALAAFQAGQRLAPGDRRFAEGIARARAARR